ncbi:hypothetical protein JL720_15335 [Aureococcus anophagefferens]|nr:hypothetical protein JL720_15335 [Aureococcus anophagefferens]
MHLSVQRPFDPQALDYVEVEFDGPKLGISFGPDGRVDSVMPGGEAMAKGIHVGDRFTCVGPDPVGASRTPYSRRSRRSGPADLPGDDAAPRHVERARPRPINFKAPAGLSFADDGKINSVEPGGEAEAEGIVGMRPGDRVVFVGSTSVTDKESVIGAIKAHTKRPMHLSVQRPFDPQALDYVEVEFDGPKLGISFGPDGRVDSVMPGGEAMAKGIHVGDRFTCVGPDPVGASKDAVLEAISSHADRPICLTMTRPHDTSNGLCSTRSTSRAPARPVARGRRKINSVEPGGEAEAEGIVVGDRISCVNAEPTPPSATARTKTILSQPDRPAAAHGVPPCDPADGIEYLCVDMTGDKLGSRSRPTEIRGVQPGSEAAQKGIKAAID